MSVCYKPFLSAVCIALLPLLAVAAPASGWQVTQPYQGNPLKTAMLTGTAQYLGRQGRATLTVVCRPDAGRPSAQLGIDEKLAGSFPVDPFEGPGGIGEKKRLVRVTLGGDAKPRSFTSTASRQEQIAFEWTFNPPKAEFQRWIKSAGKTITVAVAEPDGKGRQLQATFQLPAVSQPFSEMVMPCLK